MSPCWPRSPCTACLAAVWGPLTVAIRARYCYAMLIALAMAAAWNRPGQSAALVTFMKTHRQEPAPRVPIVCIGRNHPATWSLQARPGSHPVTHVCRHVPRARAMGGGGEAGERAFWVTNSEGTLASASAPRICSRGTHPVPAMLSSQWPSTSRDSSGSHRPTSSCAPPPDRKALSEMAFPRSGDSKRVGGSDLSPYVSL